MNAQFSALAIVLALASLVVSLTTMNRNGDGNEVAPSEEKGKHPLSSAARTGTDSALEARIAALERALGSAVASTDGEDGDEVPAVDERIATLENSIAKLQDSFNGISLESASEERDELFRSAQGYLKADEYFEAGKFLIAAEGYLTFLEANPEYEQAYDVLRQARKAFTRAGNDDKAIWAQKELVRNLGEARRSEDVMMLARLQQKAGYMDDAILHAAEAAEVATDPQVRLWNRMYWAWYNQLRDGNDAGLDAYRQVQQEIDKAGYTDAKLGEGVRDKISRIEQVQNSATAAQ